MLNLISTLHLHHGHSDTMSSLGYWMTTLTLVYGLPLHIQAQDLDMTRSHSPIELIHPTHEQYLLYESSQDYGGSSDFNCTIAQWKSLSSLIFRHVRLRLSSGLCCNYGCGVHLYLLTIIEIRSLVLLNAFLSPWTVYQSLFPSGQQCYNYLRMVSLLNSPSINVYLGPTLPAILAFCHIQIVIDHGRFSFRSTSQSLFSLLTHSTEFAFRQLWVLGEVVK